MHHPSNVLVVKVNFNLEAHEVHECPQCGDVVDTDNFWTEINETDSNHIYCDSCVSRNRFTRTEQIVSMNL